MKKSIFKSLAVLLISTLFLVTIYPTLPIPDDTAALQAMLNVGNTTLPAAVPLLPV